MRLIALLALVVLVPLAAAGGYVAKPDRSLDETIKASLVEDSGSTEETWLYYVTKGPLKGQTADAGMVLFSYSKAALKSMGALAGKYVVASCTTYSTTGEPLELNERAVQSCTWRTVTEKQVREHVERAGIPGLVL